jgi:hypothetical protein
MSSSRRSSSASRRRSVFHARARRAELNHLEPHCNHRVPQCGYRDSSLLRTRDKLTIHGHLPCDRLFRSPGPREAAENRAQVETSETPVCALTRAKEHDLTGRAGRQERNPRSQHGRQRLATLMTYLRLLMRSFLAALELAGPRPVPADHGEALGGLWLDVGDASGHSGFTAGRTQANCHNR